MYGKQPSSDDDHPVLHSPEKDSPTPHPSHRPASLDHLLPLVPVQSIIPVAKPWCQSISWCLQLYNSGKVEDTGASVNRHHQPPLKKDSLQRRIRYNIRRTNNCHQDINNCHPWGTCNHTRWNQWINSTKINLYFTTFCNAILHHIILYLLHPTISSYLNTLISYYLLSLLL